MIPDLKSVRNYRRYNTMLNLPKCIDRQIHLVDGRLNCHDRNSSSMLSHSCTRRLSGGLQGTSLRLLRISGDWTLPHYTILQEQNRASSQPTHRQCTTSWDDLGRYC